MDINHAKIGKITIGCKPYFSAAIVSKFHGILFVEHSFFSTFAKFSTA